jgi:outer membrane lipoprotein-sorting protein
MNSFDRTLELFASREADAAVIDEAQRTLETLVANRVAANSDRLPVRRARGWLAAAASVAVAAVAMLWLPFGSTPALAFAQVQQHFRDFRTLRFDMEQRMNGQVMMKSRVSMTRDGSVRTDVGEDVSVIVNSAERRVLTLLHSEHMAVVSPLGAPVKEQALDWLRDIRDFQGAAKPLPRTRVIDGLEAHGWELEIAGGNLVLWATAEGLPLEMTMSGDAPLRLSFHFEFDLPFEPRLFSTEIPAGYSRGESED